MQERDTENLVCSQISIETSGVKTYKLRLLVFALLQTSRFVNCIFPHYTT